MKLGYYSDMNKLRPLKTSLPEMHHITIETNQTCNLKCRTCYNLYQDSVKTFEQIKTEIDLALTKRNLETVTLIGGEPTLHPGLIEVIKYVKSKGLICQLLTNGIGFNENKELHIVIQDGPFFDSEKNALHLCYHCPDATIRNGKIPPVCVADLINPINHSIPQDEMTRRVYDDVYSHLKETD